MEGNFGEFQANPSALNFSKASNINNGYNSLSKFGQVNPAGYGITPDSLGKLDVSSLMPDLSGNGGGMFDFLGKDGLANLGSLLEGGASLFGAWTGAQQLKQADEQFDFTKGAFNRNLSNQAQTVNTRLEDRQRARIGGTGDGNAAGNYQSLDTYLAKNKVDGSAIK